VANKNGKIATQMGDTDPKKRKRKQNYHHPKTFKSLSHTPTSCLIVLELGSGAGLPGILAAKMGATLVCIEFKFLDLLLRNVSNMRTKKICTSPRLVNNNQLGMAGLFE